MAGKSTGKRVAKKTKVKKATALDIAKAMSAGIGNVCPEAQVDTESFKKAVRGLPIPNNLALQYVLRNDCIPLSTMMMVHGEKETFKSTACVALFANEFFKAGGIVARLDTENKSNPAHLKSVLWDKAWFKLMQFGYAPDQDTMWAYITGVIETYKDLIDKKMIPATTPLLIINDSISQAFPTKYVDIIKKTKEVPPEAYWKQGAVNKGQIAAIAGDLNRYPILMLNVCHEGATKQGSHSPTVTGGTSKDYMGSIFLRFSKEGTDQLVSGNVHRIIIRPTKNSFGPKVLHNVVFPYIEGYVEGSADEWGNKDGMSYFDSDWAIARLLTEDKIHKPTRNKFIGVAKTNNTTFNCLTPYGLKAVHPREIGEAIHNDEYLMFCLKRELLHCQMVPSADPADSKERLKKNKEFYKRFQEEHPVEKDEDVSGDEIMISDDLPNVELPDPALPDVALPSVAELPPAELPTASIPS